MESAPQTTQQLSGPVADITANDTSATASLPAEVAPQAQTMPAAASPPAEVAPQAQTTPAAASVPAEVAPQAQTTPAAASPPAEVAPQAQTAPANVQASPTANSPASTAATPAAGDGSGFQTTNGQLTYNGALLSGVAVTGQYVEQVGAQQAAATIKADFPNINVVRLATSPNGGAFSQGNSISGGESVADIDAAIQAFNAQGIGVIVDNHGADSSTADNVSQDGGEPAWFGQLASDNKNNNNVMFQTQNEPTGGDGGADVNSIVQEQQAAYNAIRANGFNGVVAFEAGGGNWSGPFTSAPSTYDGDSNYVIDFHQYPGGQTSVQSFESDISSSITEANGSAVPVYIGETGIASASQTPNASDAASLQSAFTDGTGAVTWLFDGSATGFSDANHLTNADGSLTGYGQTVAGLIQQGAS
jgi:hypothetical protein